MQVPWLPDTVLVPVAHVGDTDRPDQAMNFARSVAPALPARNPDVVLHHMHDQLQDVLMAERMSYFRVKWRRLPPAYAAFIDEQLAPDGTVVVDRDHSSWPVTRVGPRHVFQVGGRGGTPPAEYLALPHAPAPDDVVAESEWGLDADFRDDVRAWCAQRGYRYTEIGFDGPQATAAAVATVMRNWYRARGEPANRLVVPCFVLADPWQTICAAAVPFWIFFAVQPALHSVDAYLGEAEPYADVNMFLFEHGAESPGIATPEQFATVVRRHGAAVHLTGWTENAFPMTSARWAATARHLINCPGPASHGARCPSRRPCRGSRPPPSHNRRLVTLAANQAPRPRLAGSVFPGRRAIHLAVVLRQVTLHPIYVRRGNVNTTASTLHDAASGHHSARYGKDFAVDDIADQQLVRREIVFAVGVVPDMSVAVLLIRLIFCIGPPADTLIGRVAVPVAVGIC
jgi:hypothetical protein